MDMSAVAPEIHRAGRLGWLRAAVLGADDGIVSTASLLVGVSTSGAASLIATGVAAIAAGSMSMAAGEWVSVSAQRDAERADIATERLELATDPEGEFAELVAIYEQRGVPHDLAERVVRALTSADALAAHLRDELGLTPRHHARPIQASLASAVSFAMGGALPTVAVALAPGTSRTLSIVGVSLLALAMLGAAGARAGRGAIHRGALRVIFGGAFAMAVTATIGHLVNAAGL
jgi:VIT1/CCC1 family predicted Fe2+/Mn2+ transporter